MYDRQDKHVSVRSCSLPAGLHLCSVSAGKPSSFDISAVSVSFAAVIKRSETG